MISLTIDGRDVEVPEGLNVLEAARRAGIRIPTLCYHESLQPYGGCRLCMVEVTENGQTQIRASCDLQAREGQVVQTDTERLVKGRRLIMELLLARCPEVKAIQDLAAEFGVETVRFRKQDKDCILCGLCVRVCREIAGASGIGFIDRGSRREVGTPFRLPSTSCIGCGSCDYLCPTGAMRRESEAVERFKRTAASERGES